jgi:hypothetical protein
MMKLAPKFPFAVDVEKHAGESAIGIHPIAKLPDRVRKAPHAIANHTQQSARISDPNPSIVHVDDESTLRSQRSRNMFEYSAAMFATLNHTDRTVQASRQVERVIGQEV